MFFQFLNLRFMKEQRDVIAKKYNVKGVGPVGKKVGEVWKGMSDAEKVI